MARSGAGTPVRERIKGYQRDEILGQHFSRFYTNEDRARGCRQGHSLRQPPRASLKVKAGASARMEPASGPAWLSMCFMMIAADTSASPRLPVTLPSGGIRSLRWKRPAKRYFNRRRWKRSGQSTGGIAHDFNNLLAAILGSLELARKLVDPETRLARLLDNATRGAQRGASLTKRMLAFARHQELNLQAGRSVRSHTWHDRPAGNARWARQSGIEIQLPSNLAAVVADANQLEMARAHLAVNARDAMPEGGVLTLAGRMVNISSADEQLSPGSHICLSIRDNGEWNGRGDAHAGHSIRFSPPREWAREPALGCRWCMD